MIINYNRKKLREHATSRIKLIHDPVKNRLKTHLSFLRLCRLKLDFLRLCSAYTEDTKIDCSELYIDTGRPIIHTFGAEVNLIIRTFGAEVNLQGHGKHESNTAKSFFYHKQTISRVLHGCDCPTVRLIR